MTDKKLKTIAEFELPSEASALTVEEPFIYALTTKDSLIALRFGLETGLQAMFGDEVSRYGLHQIQLTSTSISLISDMDCSVVGLWNAHEKRVEAKTTTIFEASLSSSILRFRHGKVRPSWDSSWTSTQPSDGIIPSTRDASETLGIGIDGSLHHFTVLEKPAWKLLRLIQDLFQRKPKVRSISAGQFLSSDAMGDYKAEQQRSKVRTHINGDILLRCMSHGIEGLRNTLQAEMDSDDEVVDNAQLRYRRFCELAADLFTSDGKEGQDPVEVTFHWLADLLRPVI